jgi:hypothetical protein
MQFIFRFIVGGLIVSFFAALGGVFKPKSFAGLFGASPSIALATLGLTISAEGHHYAAMEARSMIIGAVAFFAYACVTIRLIMKLEWRAAPAAISALAVWLGVAVGGWALVLR